MSLLTVNNLNIHFTLTDKTVRAVRDLSLTLNRGETLGLVGESGCGKTVTAYSILRLLKNPGKIASGTIMYNNKNLTTLHEKGLRKIRGKEISMIFQEPMSSLNPVFKVGYQITETIMLHLQKDKKVAKEYAIELLHMVGIPNANSRYNAYPHELSGGMRQRVMIAIALSANPSILIADEPTTALDVTIQSQILDLLLRIQQERQMSLLMISHDLGVVANIADKIAIMYAGEIFEYGTVSQLFSNPLHPYTKGLFEAIPKIGTQRPRLKTIPGNVPTITQEPQGCIFYPRCFLRDKDCLQKKVELLSKEEGHLVRCIKI
jgi:oligopeptide/dipeptide ABC transporter ATP-binding protein